MIWSISRLKLVVAFIFSLYPICETFSQDVSCSCDTLDLVDFDANLNLNQISCEFENLQVVRFEIDTSEKIAALRLSPVSRNGKRYKIKGYLVGYNYSTNQLLWVQPAKTFKLFKAHNQIFFIDERNQFSSIDLATGNPKWSQQFHPRLDDPVRNQIIGTPSGNSYDIEYISAIDINSGKVKWKTPIELDYGLPFFYRLSDTLVVVNKGYTLLNLESGKVIMEFERLTGYERAFSSISNTPVGVRRPYRTGFISGQASNVLIDDQAVYFNSANGLSKVENDSIIWSLELTKRKKVGHSILRLHNGKLYCLDFGFGYGYSINNNSKVSLGSPTLTVHDPINGSLLHKTKLDNYGVVHRYFIQDTTVVVGIGDRLYSLELNPKGDFKPIKTHNGSAAIAVKARFYMHNFFKNQNTLISQITDTSHITIMNSDAELYKYTTSNSHLEQVANSEDTVYFNRIDFSNFTIFHNSRRFAIGDSEYRSILGGDGSLFKPIQSGVIFRSKSKLITIVED